MGNREEIPRVRGTPKVQTWNRRNQVKLSGKRTLPQTTLESLFSRQLDFELLEQFVTNRAGETTPTV